MTIRGIIFAVLAATTLWLCKTSPEIKGGGESGVIMQLPERVPHFAGVKMQPDQVEIEVLPKDTEFAKMVYHSEDAQPGQGDIANVSIVLSGADRRSIHRPEVCLKAQGWTILDSSVMPVSMSDGRTLRVRDLYISKPVTLRGATKSRDIRAHYVYWFAGMNVSTPDHAERIWITLRDNILTGINHRWAYASVMALVTENFSPQEIGQRTRTDEQTMTMLQDLIRELTPKFQKEFMPSR